MWKNMVQLVRPQMSM